MKSFFANFWKHIQAHIALYVWLPLFLVLSIGAVHFIYYLTGRAPDEDPSVLLSLIYNAIKVVLAIALTSFVKGHVLLNRPVMIPPSVPAAVADGVADMTTLAAKTRAALSEVQFLALNPGDIAKTAEAYVITSPHELWASRLSTVALFAIILYVLSH